MPTTTEINTKCPHCEYSHDRQTGKRNTVPKNGDVSICRYCCRISLYVITEHATTLRIPTDQELNSLLERAKINARRTKRTRAEAAMIRRGLVDYK